MAKGIMDHLPAHASLPALIAMVLWTVSAAPAWGTASDELPMLGDASSAIISPQLERQIGQQFLRQVRGQVPSIDDPILKYYTELHLRRLAQYSQLRNKTLYPVLIDSPEINAFAAPGGVVGINMGLYLAANDSHEYSAVLAHELAHLSQRHFARGVEMQQRQTLPYLAAMLASIAVAVTAGGDAGMAAMSGTQAAMQQNQLRYSRGREQEADRLGIDTLHRADMDPYAMARMFERMGRAYQFSQRPPEFLLTHPVTESRVADANNQAAGFPRKRYLESSDFYLMRARVKVHYATTPSAAVEEFRDHVDDTGADWAYYGLAVALAKAGRPDDALDTIKPITEAKSGILYKATEAELLIAANRNASAIELVRDQLALHPDNKPLMSMYARALNAAGKYEQAKDVLEDQAKEHPNDPDIWYELAETAGKAGDIIAVHLARAEFFQLIGRFQNSLQHLQYARSLADPEDYKLTATLDQRIRDLHVAMTPRG